MRELIGLKIVAIKGRKEDRRSKHVYPQYIFFDDGETILELSEQDYYTYHDCASYARELNIRKDKIYYKNMINLETLFDSNIDI